MTQRPRYYILNKNKRVIPVKFLRWATWFEHAKLERIVAQSIIGKIKISTVFVGLDMSFNSVRPLLFETMIFGGHRDGETHRYSTMTAAKINHRKIVKEINDFENTITDLLIKKQNNEN